jgi:hypothetical protein
MNHDGYLSREDFELVAKRLVENASGITKEKTEEIHAAFLSIADLIGLKPGVKIPLDEAAKIGSDRYLSPTSKKPTAHHDLLFNCIDTNSDGHISIIIILFFLLFFLFNNGWPFSELQLIFKGPF